MKLIEIKKGDTFSVQGALFTLIDVKDGTAILRDVRKDRTTTYGFEALRRVVHQFGYEIIRPEAGA